MRIIASGQKLTNLNNKIDQICKYLSFYTTIFFFEFYLLILILKFNPILDQDLIEIQNTNVEFATYITENVLDGNYSDGIFGLGFSNDKTPVWKTAFNQNLFDKQVFTIMLEKGDPKQGEHAGTLEFGSTDGCKSESIKFFNVTNYHDSWEFAFNSTLFNGEPLSYSRPHNVSLFFNKKMII